MTSKKEFMKIIQISDTHLFARDESEMYGVRSNLKFKEVVLKIQEDEIATTDCIIMTGDLSQDETEQSYQHIVTALDNNAVPIYWIPGNHDNFLTMETVFKETKNFKYIRELNFHDWNFIFINTKLDNRNEGYLTDTELNLLKNKIMSLPNKKIAIIMHHHPIEVSTPLIDNYILKNKIEFWNVIGSNIALIICGHVHGDYSLKYNETFIESGPATCLQWQKGTKDLKIDTKIGYKIYHFDGSDYHTSVKMW